MTAEQALNEIMEYSYGMLTAEKIGLQHKIQSMLEQPQLADGDRAVSLNAVLDVMHEMWGDSGELLDAIMELPPVTLQPKTGHWERVSIDKYIQHAMAFYRCSECGNDIIGEHNYCPSCGAKMVEPQNLKYADNDTMMPAT